jgi:hypothetical protein
VAPAERGGVHVEAEVLAGWKAELPRYVEFFGDGDCDYPLVEGESYLIFLEREPEGDLRTARCRGNRRGSEASVMLNWLQHHGQRTPPADATAPPG